MAICEAQFSGRRMKLRLFALALAVCQMPAIADAHSNAEGGQCYWTTGILTGATEVGMYIEIPTTKVRLILRAPRSTDHVSSNCSDNPERVYRAFRNNPLPDGENTQAIKGRFRVCKIQSQPPLLREPTVCIDSASMLTPMRWSKGIWVKARH